MPILEIITFIKLGLANIVLQLLLFALKASQTQDDGGYGSLGQPPIPTPSFNLPENHKPWPNNAEDPFQLLRCSQNSTRY